MAGLIDEPRTEGNTDVSHEGAQIAEKATVDKRLPTKVKVTYYTSCSYD